MIAVTDQDDRSFAALSIEGQMEDKMDVDKDLLLLDDTDYPSICIPSCDNKKIVHLGQPDFDMQMNRYFVRDELKARHQIMRLKRDLNAAKGEDFWSVLEEGMSTITGSQYAFVAKRILKDDSSSAVEMPPLGEEGSCLMGLVYFIKNDEGKKFPMRNVQYKGYKCPCAHMRHDKTLVIPDHLHSMFLDNPNTDGFPFPAEAYLAIPLFLEEKCFGHMGVMWSRKGLDNRPGLSWAFIECFFRALEDLVISRILESSRTTQKEGQRPAKPWSPGMSANVVPNSNVGSDQMVRPAARTLSHELRTPLQGVVGMLDVMLSSLEILDEEQSPNIRNFVDNMRRSIEDAQDSALRVVDAADNMVHALEINTEISLAYEPGPLPIADGSTRDHTDYMPTPAPSSVANGDRSPRGRKRSHSPEELVRRHHSPPRSRSKSPELVTRASRRRLHRSRGERANSMPPDELRNRRDETLSRPGSVLPLPPTGKTPMGTHTIHQDPSGNVTLNHKRLNLKEFISSMLQNALKSGGRPEQVHVVTTSDGQVVRATRKNTRGETGTLEIEWSVKLVPPVIIIDKLTLEKTFYAVLHNAVKFTTNGRVEVMATVPHGSNKVHFTVKDTGPGIQPQFIPDVFKMWKRGDESLNRKFDGVGLGLYVAKSLALKLGGDIILQHTAVTGEKRGCEFHIVLPMEPIHDQLRGPRSESPMLRPRQELTWPREKPSSGSKSVPVSPAVGKVPPLPQTPNEVKPQIEPPPPPPPSQEVQKPRKRSLSSLKGKDFDRELGKKIPLRILVAEDNQINRGILVNMLKRLGYAEILEAIDGEDAVRVMRDTGDRPVNLVLMDLWMPRMNGFDATEKIMALPQYTNGHARRLVVLAVSADASPDAHRDVVRVGMTGFLKKPHTLPMLEQIIKDHCSNLVFTNGTA